MMYAICTLSSGPSFFRGWSIAMGSLPKAQDYLLAQLSRLSGVMRAAAVLPNSSSSYLEKVTFLTPSVASSTGLISGSVFVSNYAFSRVGAFTCRLLHTRLNTVFRSARSPADHTSVLPHLEICVHSSDEHCNHWPSGICGCLSCGMEQSSARTPWQKHESDVVPEETENLFIQNQLVNSCATFGAWCKSLLTMLLWIS